MVQDCVARGGEEKASTSSRLNTNDAICLMAFEASGTHLVGERQSIVRPPLFVRDKYAYWKTRMRLFIQANDYKG